MTSERTPKTLFYNCPWENNGASIESKAVTSIGNYRPQEDVGSKPIDLNPSSVGMGFATARDDKDIFKAYIPWFLYKPPYGFPREANPILLRQFSKNAYIFSTIKTIADLVSATPYDIVLREEYSEEHKEGDEDARKQIIRFFDNPNGNDESFEHILRCWTKDVCEIGNFTGIKVFNKQGQFTQLFARDAATFLLNPDIHGYYGNRAEFVPPPTQYALTGGIPTNLREQMLGAESIKEVDKLHEKVRSEHYDIMYRDSAAYFQYGWTAGARPVPFGKREIIWGGINPRTDSIYHQSPIEILYNQILTLVYGSEYNLDFYLNNNLPNGLITLKGASEEQARMYRTQMQAQFMDDDSFGNFKKKHFKVPITGYEAEFTQLQMTSKEMEVIEQQKWFTKLVWSVFGVTAAEMGYSDDSNRATDVNQSNVAKRKAVKPFIKMFEYMINTQLMPEFGHPEYEFKFIDYDLAEDKAKHDLWEQEIRMGVRTPKQIATDEMGISESDFQQVEEQQESQDDWDDDWDDEWDNEQEEQDKINDEDKEKFQSKALTRKQIEQLILNKLEDLKKLILQEVETQKSILAEVKGYFDYKAFTQDTLNKYEDYFNDETIKELIRSLLGKEFARGVEKIERQLNRNVVVSTQDVNEYTEYVFNNIKDMSQELINNLRKQITMGLMNREPMSFISKRIQDQFELSKNRTRTILRTETNRIYGEGNHQAAMNSGIEFYKYVSVTMDNRTSEICKNLDRDYGSPDKAIPITEHFKLVNGKEELHNPYHVGCRTVTLYIPKSEVINVEER